MSDLEKPAEENVEHQPSPPPVENPRMAVIRGIGKTVAAQHLEENAENAKIPSVDDEGNVTPAPEPEAAAPAAAPEPAATPSAEPSEPSPEAPAGAPAEAINPDADYEVIVEGQKLLVKGATIIDAGKRTLQKEAAADHKLRLASDLLAEAERRAAATQQGAPSAPPATPQARTEAQLAHALQFGTPEESANAVRELRGAGLDEAKIMGLIEERSRLVAADEFEFRRGQALLHRDFKDLMERPAMRRLFESEDARLLQAGDKRPYVDRYRAIGEQLRKDFGLKAPAAPVPAAGTPPAGSAAARQAAKASAPSVPRTAAARLGEGTPAAKPVSNSDIIAGMAAARGKHQLSSPRK